MKAMNDRVIARVGYMKESHGGIILASSTMEDGKVALNVGKVVTCGPGLILRTGERIEVGVKDGDIITWEQFGGLRYDILGKDMVCIRAEDIGCVLEPGEYEQYLFTDEEINSYKKKIEDDRDAFIKSQRDVVVVVNKVFQCWNNKCEDKLRDVENKEVCETCGTATREKVVGAGINVIGGTPRFH